MKRFAVAALVASVVCGCGRSTMKPVTPLSVTEWKALPRAERYSREVLDRLQAGDPSLQTPEGWEAFSRTALAEVRRRDSSGGR